MLHLGKKRPNLQQLFFLLCTAVIFLLFFQCTLPKTEDCNCKDLRKSSYGNNARSGRTDQTRTIPRQELSAAAPSKPAAAKFETARLQSIKQRSRAAPLFSLGQVPQIVWQTVKTFDSVPKEGIKSSRSWAERNPSWDVRVVDDNTATAWVGLHFSEDILKLYKALPYGVMRSDLWRYMVLYVHGGVYSDLDTECRRPVEDWLPRECAVAIAAEKANYFLQWTIVSAPRHPLMKKVLDRIFKKIAEKIDLANPHVVHGTTGPAIFTDAIFDWLGEERKEVHEFQKKYTRRDGVCLFDDSFFDGHNVRHMFASEHWNDKAGYASWKDEVKRVHTQHAKKSN